MPHIVTFDGLFATQAGFQEPDDFLKLGDIKGEFQADELTGEGRQNRWELNFRDTGYEGSGTATCSDLLTTGFDTQAPSMSMHQGAMNSVRSRDAAGNYRDAAGNMPETFEPLVGMDSFGVSLNPAPGLGGTAGPGATSFMTGQFDFPTNNITGSASPGGDNV